jgi:uncharacterized phosphosugar-binding protein
MSVGIKAFVDVLTPIMDRVVTGQAESVGRAADLIVAGLRAGGVVQTFGSGHSEAFAMELAGRAGGLVPTNRLALRDVVIFGDAPRELVADEKLERDPGIAHQVYALAAPRPPDVFVMASQSGINGSVVELARLVKQRGHALIAVTSVAHTVRVPPRHPSGQRLVDLADVVLDNGAPYGDAVLPLHSGGTPTDLPAGVAEPARCCAVSSVTGALLAQLVTAEVVRRFQVAGEVPPIYLSANVPGGDEHNHTLESRYAGRIRRTA